MAAALMINRLQGGSTCAGNGKDADSSGFTVVKRGCLAVVCIGIVNDARQS